ncbi:hypothetical protein [Desulfosporosinus sp. OT]|uniref:hypothetical protein n=1 Tax=Desulfosporosinus sp. OT TaxID=913865 RepID=UPI0002239F80|nr:hypothetical protein [Desulfosporosinus sp. OT]EGW40679.1 hypothetical protein DOT_1302 [Desulfosporosinus sp. OT]
MSVEQTISKVRAEMTQNNANSYIQVVGGFLLDHLDKNPEDAEKIFNADKTISKSFDEIRKAAEKKKVGNSAMFTPQEGFAIVMKYFGIDTVVDMQRPVAPAPIVQPKSDIDFDIKLEDLL